MKFIEQMCDSPVGWNLEQQVQTTYNDRKGYKLQIRVFYFGDTLPPRYNENIKNEKIF